MAIRGQEGYHQAMKSKSHLALWMAAIQTLPNAGTVIDATKFVKLTQRLQRLLSKAASSVFASSAAVVSCVVDVHLVVYPWTRESCGFGFVTMSKLEEAECCFKYLDRTNLWYSLDILAR
ncbi:hypothetical protein F8388_001476 [Cannabis sativa]|uniref:RRM domain-containing protein n=1 Tax=Cannabis sativa TaxID=3483 RepID=A0A7J6GNA4_CANSA|nr:hypothetical protein F8388_001476 [Cannabis sativa]